MRQYHVCTIPGNEQKQVRRRSTRQHKRSHHVTDEPGSIEPQLQPRSTDSHFAPENRWHRFLLPRSLLSCGGACDVSRRVIFSTLQIQRLPESNQHIRQVAGPHRGPRDPRESLWAPGLCSLGLSGVRCVRRSLSLPTHVTDAYFAQRKSHFHRDLVQCF